MKGLLVGNSIRCLTGAPVDAGSSVSCHAPQGVGALHLRGQTISHYRGGMEVVYKAEFRR